MVGHGIGFPCGFAICYSQFNLFFDQITLNNSLNKMHFS